MKVNSLISSILGLAIAILFSSSNLNAQIVFSYTGSAQYYTVPAGVTVLNVCVTGAAGANSTDGGYGTLITGSIPVSEGLVLELNVGGMGVDTIGGWNGGGAGGSSVFSILNAGGGGGASDIRVPPYALGDRIIVAGGGGGMGGGADNADGGDALCPDGEDGEDGFGPGGGGATPTAPGLGGIPWGGGNSGEDGTLGSGGAGAMDTCFSYAPGGGGGGGWYGGGGGAADCFNDTSAATGGGGGGGSSWIPVGGSCTEYVGTADGEITINCVFDAAIEDVLRMTAMAIVKQDELWIISEDKFYYQIMDLNGRLLNSGSGIDKTESPLHDFSRGVYLISVKSDKGEWRGMIVR